MTRLLSLLTYALLGVGLFFACQPRPACAQAPVTWSDTTRLGDSALTIAFKRQVTVTDSTKLVRLVTATSGIPNGPFHLTPAALCANPDFSASTLTANAATLLRDLAQLQGCKKRVVLILKRSAMKDSTGLSAAAGLAEIATWPDIGPYVTNGTVIAIYVGDDVTADEWGPIALPVRLAFMDEMACGVRRRWPTVPTTIRAKPIKGELADRAWICLTTAWAQYRGPYRDKDPKRWADSMVTAAAKLKLGIIVGHNLLDGGCGPVSLGGCLLNVPGTAILGTFANAAAVRRFQTSAPELVLYKTTFLSASGTCASIDWRESQGFTASRPAAQLSGIQGFNTKLDIKAGVKAIAVVARSKTPASCIHPSRR